MSHIDLIARMVGLDQAQPEQLLTPDFLITTYCAPGMRTGFREAERREHSDWQAGFIGWTSGEHGYDDGYSYMEALIASGWLPRPELGDWPYVIYLIWPARPTDPRYAIAHYCEGDFGIEVFDDKPSAQAGLRALRVAGQEAPR
jgi:hypothetical protein